MYMDIKRLGFSDEMRTVTFFVEGIAPSTAPGNERIVATLCRRPSLLKAEAPKPGVLRPQFPRPLHPIIHPVLVGVHEALQAPMPVREKPAAHRHADATQNQQLIFHNQRRQHHERHAADRDGRAGRHAADERLERRIKDGCEPKQKHAHAEPHNALEARQLRAALSRRILLRRPKLRLRARLLALYNWHRRSHQDGLQIRHHRAAIVRANARLFQARSGGQGVAPHPNDLLILLRHRRRVLRLHDGLLNALRWLARRSKPDRRAAAQSCRTHTAPPSPRPAKNVLCDNNYRQGISVISVDGLLVEDSSFNNTWGTPPSSGVDLEPDSAHELMKNVVFRNCSFKDNYGDGIEIFLANLRSNPPPVSILLDRCNITSQRGLGIRFTRVSDDGPEGLIEFRNCNVEGTEAYGIKVRDVSADRAKVRFAECVVRDAARDRQYAEMWSPLALETSQSDRQKRFAGVEFVNCTVEDERARPAILARAATGLFNVTGDITVRSRHPVKAALGEKLDGVTLNVRTANLSPFRHAKVFAVPGRFASWPANHGLWSWGNEILVGFSRGFYQDLGDLPNIDRDRPEEHLLARSLDGGETWTIERSVAPWRIGADWKDAAWNRHAVAEGRTAARLSGRN